MKFDDKREERQQSSFLMAIDYESALSTSTLQELSAGLATVAAANAERLLPSGADKEMKKLSESVQQIAPLLKGAKVKHRKELEDMVSDIISILQLFSPKGAIDQISQNRRANPKTTMELKDIRARLDKILKKPHFISSQPATEPHGITKMAIGCSPVEPLVLSGKNYQQDQEKIIDLLLSVKGARQAGPCLIPIDRKGVTGTTEFARAILDDNRVVKHFGRRIWINASEIVDSGKLSKLISKPASTMFWVHKTLSKKLEEEQQLLIVLDDIRNYKTAQHRTRWIRAERKINWIHCDCTEDNRRIVLNPEHHQLRWLLRSSRRVERLSAEDSWILFKECVFMRVFKGSRAVRIIRERPQLEAIGRNIVKNLEGSRSMIQKIGSILASSLDQSHWKLVLESQVWKLPVDEEISQQALVDVCYTPYQSYCDYALC